MYNLPHFKEPDSAEVKKLMREHPFAMLIGSADNTPVATQVPLLLEERDGQTFLKGHIMRQSDHHKALLQNNQVLCVFTGPHTYVSASWYTNPQVASTWNYMSVHARGTLRFLPDEALLQILESTTTHFEADAASPARFNALPGDYVQRLVKAIIGFEITVTALEHVFKLSQNHPHQNFQNIIRHLAQGDADAQAIAQHMQQREARLFPQPTFSNAHMPPSLLKPVLIILVLYIASCAAAHPKKYTPMLFDKEGHRGCRGLMPENTIPAMLKAIDLGVTTLEMDAVITADSEVLLSHEPFFNHEITTTKEGTTIPAQDEKRHNIYKMTYAETEGYDVGLKPHPRFPQQQKMAVHKPLLRQVIEAVEAYTTEKKLPPLQYNIETKTTPATDGIFHPEPETFVRLLMQVIEQKGIAARVIIQSFDVRTLQVLHQRYPEIKTALLVEDFDKKPFAEQLRLLGFTPTIYSPDHSLVTATLVQQCHDSSVKIIPWTVNEKETIVQLKAMGVDGVITDYPNLFATLR